MKIGYVQLNPVLGKLHQNIERIEDLVRKASPSDLLVLPELALSGYALGDRERARALAITATGEEMNSLLAIARDARSHLVIGFAERAGERVYNSAALISPFGLKGIYRKTHLFWHEKDLFDPGDTGFAPLAVGGVKVGMIICFDWLFPEAAGSLVRKGAAIIAHPSNLVLPHAETVMPVRCLENGVFGVTANRIGEERGPDSTLKFRGASTIISAKGEILSKAPPDREAVDVVEIDPTEADDKRLTPRNHLINDRKPEFYS